MFVDRKDWSYNREKCFEDIIVNQRKPDDVCLDIGSHYGQWTIPMAKASGKVYAVEPTSKTIDILLENIKLNNLTNVEIIPKVAHAISGKMMQLFTHEKQPAFNCTIGYQRDVGKVERTEVESIAIDDLNLEKLDFFKIDTEGAELQIIKGMIKTIERCHPKFLIEMHEGMGYRIYDILKILYKYDYKMKAYLYSMQIYIYGEWK